MKSLLILSLFAAHSALAEDAHRVYRLDFSVAENEPGKAATATAYTLNLGEHSTGEIKMATNIALAGPTRGATMRADVGLVLRASYSVVGDDLLVDNDVEISAPRDAQTFRKMSAKGNALVVPGQPALLASVEDPVGHKRYQVTLTATKLR
jgi:hypothetical protein